MELGVLFTGLALPTLVWLGAEQATSLQSKVHLWKYVVLTWWNPHRSNATISEKSGHSIFYVFILFIVCPSL